ncbi:hypothetical protein ColLi_13258 [Colletotrichum liriopes]|uniref:Ubiquitin-like protease family profile domain-containing protein n=1 Tax=Colletotrichum liriopes TaxID=708192 RepID=A0AA37H172_9PEZI|nr:hypothetical protein ColLi_13258 [Colletotrichum liriopes]
MEYNSGKSLDGAQAGGDTVANLIRWVMDKEEMEIHLQQGRCPKQPNGWDCGVYVIRFGEQIAADEPIPQTIDGDIERLCLKQAILASWQCALHPRELANLLPVNPWTPKQNMETFRSLFVRRSYLNGLLQTSVAGFQSLSSHRHTMWVICEDVHMAQQTALLSLVHHLHTVHHAAVMAALSADAELAELASLATLQQKAKELVEMYQSIKAREAAERISRPVERIQDHFDMITHIVSQTNPHFDAAAQASKSEGERHLKASTRTNHYVECVLTLLVLRHVVQKFRSNEKKLREQRRGMFGGAWY